MAYASDFSTIPKSAKYEKSTLKLLEVILTLRCFAQILCLFTTFTYYMQRKNPTVLTLAAIDIVGFSTEIIIPNTIKHLRTFGKLLNYVSI